MNIGTMVKVKSDLVTGEQYGAVKMLYDMEPMKGTIGKITDTMEGAVKVGDWWFSKEMLIWVDGSTMRGFVYKKLNELDETLTSLKKILIAFDETE